MKKIIIMIMLITIVTVAMAVRIETTSGLTHKGDLLKKVGQMYVIKTNMGNISVFEQEILTVLSDSGTDITQSFIAMDPTAEPAPKFETHPYLITNLKQISTPLWIFTIASIGYYAYAISKME